MTRRRILALQSVARGRPRRLSCGVTEADWSDVRRFALALPGPAFAPGSITMREQGNHRAVTVPARSARVRVLRTAL